MSLSMLRKECGIDKPEASTEAKATTRPGANKIRGRGSGSSGAGYQASSGEAAQGAGRSGGGGGGYYASGGAAASRSTGRGGGSSGYGPEKEGGFNIQAPKPGKFSGSSAQAAHIEAIRKATADASKESSTTESDSSLAVKSGLGLDALKERQRKEAEEKQAKRDQARAKKMNETTKKEADEATALAECEAQARRDVEENENVKYEAALIVRIACKFGSNSAWMKISEARALGANIPMDPRRVYLLAHPDKCRLPEASDATAILNAQRPPEMSEVRVTRPAAKPAPAPSTEAPADPEAEAKHQEYLERIRMRREKMSQQEDSASLPSASPAPAAAAPQKSGGGAASEEQRIDPEDGQLCTLQDLHLKYAGTYTRDEIEAYFKDECKPQRRVKKF